MLVLAFAIRVLLFVVNAAAWIALIVGLIIILDYSFLAMNGILPETTGKQQGKDHLNEMEAVDTIY